MKETTLSIEVEDFALVRLENMYSGLQPCICIRSEDATVYLTQEGMEMSKNGMEPFELSDFFHNEEIVPPSDDDDFWINLSSACEEFLKKHEKVAWIS